MATYVRLFLGLVLLFCPAMGWSMPAHTIALGGHTLKVELAIDRDDLERGLMYRKTIAPYDGMLFDFEDEIHAQMWMKNTIIPLDMVFFDGTGKIVHFHRNAVPHSLDIIACPAPARYVLELNAGDIDRLGLKLGDAFEYEVGE